MSSIDSTLKGIARELRGGNKAKREGALQNLVALCSLGAKQNRLPIFRHDAFIAVMELEDKSKKQEHFEEIATILHNISNHEATRFDLVHRHGVLDVLHNIIKAALPETPAATIQAVKCMVNLSVEPRNHSAMVKATSFHVLTRLIDSEQDEPTKWAVWCITNLAMSQTSVKSAINSGCVGRLVKVMRRRTTFDPVSSGLKACCNFAKHQSIVSHLIKQGVIDEAVEVFRIEMTEAEGEGVENVLLLLLRIVTLPRSRAHVTAKVLLPDLVALSRQPNLRGVLGFMVLIFLTEGFDETYQLTMGTDVLRVICDLVQASITNEPLVGIADAGVFGIETMVRVCRQMAMVKERRPKMVQTNLLANLMLLIVRLEWSENRTTIEIALQIIVLLSHETATQRLLAKQRDFLTMLEHTEPVSPAAETFQRDIIAVVKGGKGPRYLFIDSLAGSTRAVLCHMLNNELVCNEVETWEGLNKCVVGGTEAIQGAKHELVEVIKSTQPSHVVVGFTGWFRMEEESIRQGCFDLVESIKAEFPGMNFEILPLTFTQEANCRTRALDYAAAKNNMVQPNFILGTLHDCFFIKSGAHFLAITETTIEDGASLLLSQGINAVSEIEDTWEAAVKRFKKHDPNFMVNGNIGFGISGSAWGAHSCGIQFFQPITCDTVMGAFEQVMEKLIIKYASSEIQMTPKDAKLLSNLIAQNVLFDAFLKPNTSLRFAHQWRVAGQPLDVSWLLGHFLLEVELAMPVMPPAPPILQQQRGSFREQVSASAVADLMCGECTFRRKSAVLTPCGHMACEQCAMVLRDEQAPCPVCNTIVEGMVKAVVN